MKQPLAELKGLEVTVDRVVYQPEAGAVPDRPHCFVYFITIHNHSEFTVTIKARKWIVTNARGEVNVLEGEGVVGEQPRLASGEQFSYKSYHLLDTPAATARGSYMGMDEQGRCVVARIPEFKMETPASSSSV